MMTQPELAAYLARRIFQAGNGRIDRVQRMAFKGGRYPSNETDLGGVCEESLAAIISEALSDSSAAEKS